jgi:hypothetical protein
LPRVADRERARLRDRASGHTHIERLRAEPRPITRRARLRALVPAQEDADILFVALLLARAQERQDALETALADKPAETCGELLNRIWSEPAPEVDLKRIDEVLATRGRRSNRPA